MVGYLCNKGEFPKDLKRSNLVPRSIVDEAEGMIWSNPICTRDCLCQECDRR